MSRMSFDLLTKDARKRIADELEDLNSQLSFAVKDRPASFGDNLSLRPFSGAADRDIFATRTTDVGASGDGSGRAAGDLDEDALTDWFRANSRPA